MITLKQYNFCRKIGLPSIPHVERYFAAAKINKEDKKEQKVIDKIVNKILKGKKPLTKEEEEILKKNKIKYKIF